ncbi:MAG: hypothetical protein AAGC62_13520, partial [Pseudomonadota bacterium]
MLLGVLGCSNSGFDKQAIDRLYSTKLEPVTQPLTTFHLGHSLVGRDMPAMVAQLAMAGHSYKSQLGWGTSMREHFEPDMTINGFDVEND